MDADKLRELGTDPRKWEDAFNECNSGLTATDWFRAAIEAGTRRAREAGRLAPKAAARDAFIREAAMRIMAGYAACDAPSSAIPGSRARRAVEDATALADALGM